ncbi:deoxynucleoside triphosphate triphosphohydrolase SAMHD1-like [Odontesthes bonariensis]|uniref:deoxynucleoside triphosphate triphosphohydrolase SAMHD1-like n=1 Tax=Odontesthes bonariensis TaxID=219752 RepID=UPI003F58C248
MASGTDTSSINHTGKLFNDSIHGHIELHPLLVKIIDTPQFQRLRNIKQLGGCYYVYPGASHNRFEHSIGVAHLAGELAKSLKSRQPELKIDDRDILCVQIAGLCHDLGHGPFSHLYDTMFIPEALKKPKDDPKDPKDPKDEKWQHEDASIRMFDHLVKENGLKSEMENDLVFIKELILGKPLSTPGNDAPVSTKDENWPYKGRDKDKSFLYEIVANKLNGIDVDKFDYFARDCHHLGIKNNFDHLRYFMCVRVCEVDGLKHICCRDKEVDNLYDMFQTRNRLHRRAYQHKVHMNIEIMIKDAFLKANPYIKISGSKREENGRESEKKMFTLSTAKNDMEAYTKLTDQVFEKILHEEINGASDILKRILSRKLYKYLGQAKREAQPKKKISDKNPDPPGEISEETIETLKTALALGISDRRQDFEVCVVRFDYGMKDKDPIENVYFYTKSNPTTAFSIPRDQVSRLLPEHFSEKIIRVYWKKPDDDTADPKTLFEGWCESKGFTHTME